MLMPLSLGQLFKRHLRQLDRACYAGEKVLDKVGRGIEREYTSRIDAAKKRMDSHLTTTNYIEDVKRYLKIFRRYFKQSKAAVNAVIETTHELFRNLTEDEFNQRTEAILRIPPEELKAFNSMEVEERADRLKALILEYEDGSNGCGYSENLLNAPGEYNPHFTHDKQDQVTKKKKLPQFLYNMIDRFIYEAIKPNFYKKIFFKRAYVMVDSDSPSQRKKRKVVARDTKGKPIFQSKKVKKWNTAKRQIRAEGRMGMVKVMIVLIRYLDYKVSMRVGKRYQDKETGRFEFIGISRGFIADEANMSIESVKTALRNLEEVGVLYPSTHQYEKYTDKDGEKKCAGVPLVRKMKNFIVDALSLSEDKKKAQKLYKENPPEVEGNTTFKLSDEEKAALIPSPDSLMNEMKASLGA